MTTKPNDDQQTMTMNTTMNTTAINESNTNQHLTIQDKLKLKERILEIQTRFTMQELATELNMDRRTLARFVNHLIEEGLIQRLTGWDYKVIEPNTAWKIN